MADFVLVVVVAETNNLGPCAPFELWSVAALFRVARWRRPFMQRRRVGNASAVRCGEETRSKAATCEKMSPLKAGQLGSNPRRCVLNVAGVRPVNASP